MTIRHHLSDELLMAYSVGSLPEAFSLVVATHVSMCDDCRAQAESYDAVGGAILDDGPIARLAPDSLEATMARIRRAPDPVPARVAPRDAVLPVPLRTYVGGGLDAVTWRGLGGGVRQAVLPSPKGARVRLLSIPGGRAMPDHGHGGLELTLVLKGAYRDEFDRFGRGDIEIANVSDQHTPTAEEGDACLCLTASDAPLKFRAVLPRLLQPFLRI